MKCLKFIKNDFDQNTVVLDDYHYKTLILENNSEKNLFTIQVQENTMNFVKIFQAINIISKY